MPKFPSYAVWQKVLQLIFDFVEVYDSEISWISKSYFSKSTHHSVVALDSRQINVAAWPNNQNAADAESLVLS